jgi:RNA polymerase sigma factor FliA
VCFAYIEKDSGENSSIRDIIITHDNGVKPQQGGGGMTPMIASKLKKYTQPAFPEKKKMDIAERDSLIAQYAPLVKTIAGRMALRLPQHISQDDLKSSGLMGLLDAIDKYDPDKGVEFKSYAEFRIRGAMIDELRSMDWVPRSVRRNAKKLADAYSKVENREMRPARDEEVAAELEIGIEDFHHLLEEVKGISVVHEYEVLNQGKHVMAQNEEEDRISILGIDVTPLESLNRTEAIRVIAEAIDKLPKNERTVVSLYYHEELTMKEIGDIMGYTESRVSQLHTKAVLRLRNSLKEYFER